MNRTLAIVCAVVLAGVASGQSNERAAPSETFHVSGTIDDLVGVLPPVKVHFVGDKVDRTAEADDTGFYQIDLPVGTYTMTASLPSVGPNHLAFSTNYVRFFRVPSPVTVTLNGILYGVYSCDGVWGRANVEESYKDDCGGEDSFPYPSEDGVPFRLDIRYVRRIRGDRLVSYRGTGVIQRPVLVAYNLFALRADSLDYRATDGTIRAYGHVVFEDPTGQVRVGSAAFKFKNGEATRLW